MAKLQVVTYNYTCDVGGEVIPESEADTATQRISWEGNDYVLDVCAAHAAELDGILTGLKAFVAAGTKSSGRRGRRPSVALAPTPRATRGRRPGAAAAAGGKRTDLSEVRAWARATGRAVSERGRVPAALLAAYDAAQNGAAPSTALAAEPAATEALAAAPRKRGGGRRPAAGKSAPRRANLGSVRSWARDNGFTVSERGRIPATLLAAYEAANNGTIPDSAPAAPRKRGRRKKTAATA
ncbi:MAG: Lsr2 family DNA-binding protein [Acidimicrobiales bacterium]